MEVEFDVKITPGVLYDYMLYHTYTSASGLIGAVTGALLVVAFFMGRGVLCLIAGIVILAYLPWTLFVKSRQQYLANSAFKESLHYRLTEEGMEVSQQGEAQSHLVGYVQKVTPDEIEQNHGKGYSLSSVIRKNWYRKGI